MSKLPLSSCIRFLLVNLMIPCTASTSTSHAAELLNELSPAPLQAEGSMDALAPWETPISGFFIRSHHPLPHVDPAEWTLEIDGLVEKPLKFTLRDLARLPQTSLHAVLECSGNGRSLQQPGVSGVPWNLGGVGNAEWSGVVLKSILTLAKISPTAKFITIRGLDAPAYSTTPAFVRSIPLDKALADSSLVALRMNREPLPILHGGPARLVLPGWYGENWMKWLSRITITESEDGGFYMHKAYRMPQTPIAPGTAWDSATGAPIHTILVQSIITSPQDRATLRNGPFELAGKAFSGEDTTGRMRTIKSVSYSLDDGKTWLQALVEAPHKTGGWQEFHATVQPTALGALNIMVRATDDGGAEQPLEQTWNPGGYVHNSVHRIALTIADHDEEPPETVLRGECYRCHDRQLIVSQNLNENQWLAVLKKMGTFGAQVANPEKIANYLASHNGQHPKPLSYDRTVAELTPERLPASVRSKKISDGKKLFATHCAACHEPKGEGLIGPHLVGRNLPQFMTTVIYGRNKMPAFGAILKESEIHAIATWIEKGAH